MKILESGVVGKRGPDLCEDFVVLTDTYAAIVDGATDISGAKFGAVAGGRLAGEALSLAVHALTPELGPKEAFAYVSNVLRATVEAAPQPDVTPTFPPLASMLIYSAPARQVWSVGDLPFRVGDVVYRHTKLIDEVGTAYRLAWMWALHAQGVPPSELADTDPGLSATLDLVSLQYGFANRTDTPYGFGCVDGTPIPDEFITVVDVPPGTEVVLASDGHIDLSTSLDNAETVLADAIAKDRAGMVDPRLIRSVQTGAHSFDDRAWIRLVT